MANLGQPANQLAVAPADGPEEEAAQATLIGEQLQSGVYGEKNCTGQVGGGGVKLTYVTHADNLMTDSSEFFSGVQSSEKSHISQV